MVKVFGYTYATGDSKFHIKPVAGASFELSLAGLELGTFESALAAADAASATLAAKGGYGNIVELIKDLKRWDRYFAGEIEVGPAVEGRLQ